MTNRVIVNARPFGLHGDGGYGGNLGYAGNNLKKKSLEKEFLVIVVIFVIKLNKYNKG